MGYRAIVAAGGGGHKLEGLVDIRFNDPTPQTLEAFARLVEAIPEIVEAHRIAGQGDYLVRFCGGDISAWNTLRRSLEALGCSPQSRFSVLLEPMK